MIRTMSLSDGDDSYKYVTTAHISQLKLWTGKNQLEEGRETWSNNQKNSCKTKMRIDEDQREERQVKKNAKIFTRLQTYIHISTTDYLLFNLFFFPTSTNLSPRIIISFCASCFFSIFDLVGYLFLLSSRHRFISSGVDK